MALSLPLSGAVPVLGHLSGLLRKKLDYLVELRERQGDIFTLDLGFMRMVALCHPSHAQHVLRDRARIYGKGNKLWDSIRGLIGNGLPVSEGDFWMRQRRMIQPHFHRESLAAMAELMVDAIDEELASWDAFARSGAPIDIFREMTRITMRVIVKTVFGGQLSQKTADLVGREMGYALDYMLWGLLTHRLPAWAPAPGRKRFKEAVQRIDDVVFDVIASRKAGDGKGGALLDMLLSSVDEETQQRMTKQELRDEAISMFLAGYETTSSALAFAFQHLNQNPEVLRKLVAEIDTTLKGRRPTIADTRALPYAMGVIQESLRLHGPVYWIPRTAQEDDVIDGYPIRKGQEIVVVCYVIHRHPSAWSDPERFDPTRFDPAAVAQRHPLAWLPFGAGQRLCVGKEFALMEGQFILARILARYEVVPVRGRSTTVHVGTTLRPNGGVWVRLLPRNAAGNTAQAAS